MDIDKLEAGHALDELIHAKVMGLKLLSVEEMQAEADRVWKEQPTCRFFMMGFKAKELSFGGFGFRNEVKPYSTDLAAAWEVVEQLELVVGPDAQGGWLAQTGWIHELSEWHTAKTAPLAICRTALKTVGA